MSDAPIRYLARLNSGPFDGHIAELVAPPERIVVTADASKPESLSVEDLDAVTAKKLPEGARLYQLVTVSDNAIADYRHMPLASIKVHNTGKAA